MRAIASITGRAVALGGEAHDGWLPGGAALPQAAPRREVLLDLEIREDGGGHYLLAYRSPDGARGGDTWHDTLEDAFDHAEASFGIGRDEWRCR